MSKKSAKRSKASVRRPTSVVIAVEEYRQRFDALDRIVLCAPPGITWDVFNATLRRAIDADADAYAAVVDTGLRLRGWPDGGDDLRFVREHICTAVEIGFRMALSRYREQLKDVPELAKWRRDQKSGGDKGRATSSDRKIQNDQRIRETYERLHAEGRPCTYRAVADECGCSVSTVERAINQRQASRPTK